MARALHFTAIVAIVGINPYVEVPNLVLQELRRQSGRTSGPLPVRGRLAGAPFRQTIVKYAGAWRLYLNGGMRRATGLDVGDRADVTLEFDPEPRVTPMHPALERALSADLEARAAFDALTPSRREEILRYLASLKRAESAERVARRVVAGLVGRPAREGPRSA